MGKEWKYQLRIRLPDKLAEAARRNPDDLGYIDLEQKTLQTIDNPFGTRLSSMS